MNIKNAFAYKSEQSDADQTIVGWANKIDTVDSDLEMILPNAFKLDRYNKNKVVLMHHNYHENVHVKCLWIKSTEEGLKFKIQFAQTDVGKELYYLYSNNYMNAFSVGFRPLEWHDNEKDQKYKDMYGNIPKTVFLSVELLEISLVSVPAQPDSTVIQDEKSLISVKSFIDAHESGKIKTQELCGIACELKKSLAKTGDLDLIVKSQESDESTKNIDENGSKENKSIDEVGKKEIKNEDDKGYDTLSKSINDENSIEIVEDSELIEEKELEIVEKIEVTEEYIHIPVKNAGLFDQESFRTIDISKSEGIKAVIGKLKGEDNTTVQKYLFDKEKWSTVEAKKWVEDHKKGFEIALNIKGEQNSVEEIDEKSIKSSEENKEGKISIKEQEIQKSVPEKENDFLRTISKNFMPTEKDIEINKRLFKSFDVTEIPSIPATFNYDVFSKFLEVEVKDIQHTPYFIPNMVKGVELAGFDEVCKEFELHSERNFSNGGAEYPISYEKVQLNSKNAREFLVEGTRFYKTQVGNFVISYEEGWAGIHVNMFTAREKSHITSKILNDVDMWVEANNFLKGEKMSITGKFLGKYETTWDDIFVKEKHKTLIKRTIDNNSIEKGSRGFLLLGRPGTGKTLTGKAIMNDSEDTFIWASSDDFKSMGAVRGMSLAFDMARKLAPTTIFVEDIDTWLDYYTIDLLKTEMDGLKNNNGVVTILTSNHPEKFPEALIDRPGRFHHVFNFDLPDDGLRKQMLQKWASEVDEQKINEFVAATKGLSGAHIKELVDYARILVEDEGIEFGEALVKSLENILEQRELIASYKDGSVRKSIDIKIENKSSVELDFEIEEKTITIEDDNIELDFNIEEKEVEIDFDLNTKQIKDEVEIDFDINEFVEEQKEILLAKVTGKII